MMRSQPLSHALYLPRRACSPDGTKDDTMTGMPKRFESLRDGVRAGPKKKLPPHAVPSVIIPLEEFLRFNMPHTLVAVY